jgi:hypothetical protein
MFTDCVDVGSIRAIAGPLILAHNLTVASNRNRKNGVLGYFRTVVLPTARTIGLGGCLAAFGSVWQLPPAISPVKAALLEPVTLAKSSLIHAFRLSGHPLDAGPSFPSSRTIHLSSNISRYMSSRQNNHILGERHLKMPEETQAQLEEKVRSWGFSTVFTWTDGP